jgi:hypothetical protein
LEDTRREWALVKPLITFRRISSGPRPASNTIDDEFLTPSPQEFPRPYQGHAQNMKFDSTIGLEEIQRAALIRLFRHLNSAIDRASGAQGEEDMALADFLGRPYVPVELEQIRP